MGLFYGGEGGICFSAEKPRRLQYATGILPRAAFQIPPEFINKKRPRPIGWGHFMAEKEGFELLKDPTIFNHKLPDVSISVIFLDIIYYGLTIVDQP